MNTVYTLDVFFLVLLIQLLYLSKKIKYPFSNGIITFDEKGYKRAQNKLSHYLSYTIFN